MSPHAELVDARRLTGPNRLWDKPGALVEVAVGATDAPMVVEAWQVQARRLLDAVGWSGEATLARVVSGGVSMAISAPVDALYAAVDLNELAWLSAAAELNGHSLSPLEQAEATRRLLDAIGAERNPALLSLADAAEAHGVAFMPGDDLVTVGQGAGSMTWPQDDLPDAGDVDWTRVHDVPVALVTGTDGKTTTTRLVAAIAAAAGHVPGLSTTDGVRVAGERVATGDFAGPEGARMVLRDPRVTLAVLETARGGLARRGVAVRQVAAAVITNIAADHLGQFGLHTLDDLAEVKFVVSRVIRATGRLVLNADDPELRTHAAGAGRTVTWFTLGEESTFVAGQVAGGGDGCWLRADGMLMWQQGTHGIEVLHVADLPIALGGAARYNVANALGAIGAAAALGLPVMAMTQGLAEFRGTAEDNPGRANLMQLGGVDVLVDYAHNPHGLAALVEVVGRMPAARKLILLGQAGDRDDESIRELVRVAWQIRPDRVVVKELHKQLRGRAPGEVPAVIVDELKRLGADETMIDVAPSEVVAVRQALAWAREGDLLVILAHSERGDVLAYLADLDARGWRPGEELD